MRTIYIADDGTQFFDEFDCKSYEAVLNHPHLKTIEYLDKDNQPIVSEINFTNAFHDDLYEKSWTVIIHNEEEYNDFHWMLEEWTGWCEMRTIDGPGVWHYNDDPYIGHRFVKAV